MFTGCDWQWLGSGRGHGRGVLSDQLVNINLTQQKLHQTATAASSSELFNHLCFAAAGEFSMPGFGMDELKGPEMISETCGKLKFKRTPFL